MNSTPVIRDPESRAGMLGRLDAGGGGQDRGTSDCTALP